MVFISIRIFEADILLKEFSCKTVEQSARNDDYVDLMIMAFIAADWKVGKTGLGKGLCIC